MRIITLFLLLIMSVSVAAETSEKTFFSVGKTIEFHNEDRWFSLLGYRAQFPSSLDETHRLGHVSFGLGLSVMIEQAEADRLEPLMHDAIEDQTGFVKLSKYNPFRTIGGIYGGGERSSVIVVATMPSRMYRVVERPEGCEKYEKENGIKSRKTDVGGFTGCWIEYPDGSETSSTLSWDARGVTYMVFPLNKGKMSLDTALAYAAKVIECNRGK